MDRASPKTLYDKIFEEHVVSRLEDMCVLYIDRHLVEDHANPQAFDGLRKRGLKMRAPEKTLAVVDHNVPTTKRCLGIDNKTSRIQIETLAQNTKEFGIEYYDEHDMRQGIVHVIGPEQGFTLPGTTIVCGDSHTATHGAFGALAFGVGTSEVERVLATQTLVQKKAKTMRITVDGSLPAQTIAMMPGGGLLADADAVELLNKGFTVIDGAATSNLMVRLNLNENEIEIARPEGLAKFKGQGIDAVLVVKGAGGHDAQPQSASARMTSTIDGRLLAGTTWQNGFGGQAGSIADRVMRQGLTQTASEIAKALANQVT